MNVHANLTLFAFRDVTLIYALLHNVFLRGDTCQREGYRDKREDIRKDYERFWYEVRIGQFSISIALTELDFNVHAVSACICKQCHRRRKELDHLPQNLKDFTDFFKRQLRCKREERATLFSVQRIATRND